MTWTMHDKEFANVVSLPAPRRYEYFVKKVADWENVWSLRSDEGWVLAGDDQGRELVPVWPHERFAAACVLGHPNWKDAVPSAIPLTDWIEKWTPGMERDGRSVAVFMIPGDRGVPVSPGRLKSDLEEELSQYE